MFQPSPRCGRGQGEGKHSLFPGLAGKNLISAARPSVVAGFQRLEATTCSAEATTCRAVEDSASGPAQSLSSAAPGRSTRPGCAPRRKRAEISCAAKTVFVPFRSASYPNSVSLHSSQNRISVSHLCKGDIRGTPVKSTCSFLARTVQLQGNCHAPRHGRRGYMNRKTAIPGWGASIGARSGPVVFAAFGLIPGSLPGGARAFFLPGWFRRLATL